MATGKGYFARFNNRFLPGERDHQEYHVSSDSAFELSESDIFNSARSDSPEYRMPGKKPAVKRFDSSDRMGRIPASLPVNVPDWSKILRDEYTENQRRAISDEEDEGDGGYGEDEGEARIPPHEFLARQMARKRVASFSLHEGIGRTLKGRDLSRVRNAIWEKTGFQD